MRLILSLWVSATILSMVATVASIMVSVGSSGWCGIAPAYVTMPFYSFLALLGLGVIGATARLVYYGFTGR